MQISLEWKFGPLWNLKLRIIRFTIKRDFTRLISIESQPKKVVVVVVVVVVVIVVVVVFVVGLAVVVAIVVHSNLTSKFGQNWVNNEQ